MLSTIPRPVLSSRALLFGVGELFSSDFITAAIIRQIPSVCTLLYSPGHSDLLTFSVRRNHHATYR
jgi:hypothetical protein